MIKEVLIIERDFVEKKGLFMTTSINSVNAGSIAARNAQLNEGTQKELEALGIAVTDDISESEARQILAARTQNKANEAVPTETEVLSEAKTLASSLGLSVSDDADVVDILDDIGAEIEALLESAETNPSILSAVSGYLAELNGLDEEYSNIVALRDNYNNAIDMVAVNKKFALGL